MKLQLEYLHMVHRHGERTPLSFGPHNKTYWNMCHRVSKIDYTVPKKSASLLEKAKNLLNYMHIGSAQPLRFKIEQRSGKEFNCAPGQLTDVGRSNLFNLGNWFRKTYIDEHHLIKPVFDKNEFFLRSTNIQRTLESLQSLMQGIYRNHYGSMNVQVLDITQDTLTSQRHCPKLKLLKEKSHQRIKKLFAPQTKEIQKYFAGSHSLLLSSLSPYAIYDLVTSSHAHGFMQFMRIPKRIMNMLENYSLHLWFDHLKNKEALALYTGNVMKEIADQMLVKAANPDLPLKASIFSAHDVTVYPILMAVGADTKKWPAFGANLIFELFRDKDTGNRYVQMRYNRKKTEMPRCSPVKTKSGTYCSFENFIQMCNDTYVQNFTESCIQK